jgi:hypothetical protein
MLEVSILGLNEGGQMAGEGHAHFVDTPALSAALGALEGCPVRERRSRENKAATRFLAALVMT